MEPDIEAAAEAPRANPALHMSSQPNNAADDMELEAIAVPEDVRSEGIRRRNTDQGADAVRENNISSIDTEQTLTDGLKNRSWNIKGIYENRDYPHIA